MTFVGLSFHAFLCFADEYGSTPLCYAPMQSYALLYVYIYIVSQNSDEQIFCAHIFFWSSRELSYFYCWIEEE